MPSPAAHAMASPGRRTIRSAAAAGPMSSAVERIEPMVSAHSATDTDRASR